MKRLFNNGYAQDVIDELDEQEAIAIVGDPTQLQEFEVKADRQKAKDALQQILKDKEPTFTRLMVGNHGIYIEFDEPKNKGKFIKQRLQYKEYNRDGVKLYAQEKTVNYADYKVEKWYADVYEEFKHNTAILEKAYGDMQDIEFTIQEGKLFMLQTRSGKRCGEAAVKIAVDLVHEGLLEKRQAVMKVLPEHLDQLLHPRFTDTDSGDYKKALIAKGLPASPGAAVGHIAFTDEKVVENQKNGIPSIFVRDEVSAYFYTISSIW
jgi:hypothetical protein